MTINPDLISPCGLYCGVCAIYIAHRDNNHKFKERLVDLYKGEVPGKGRLPNSGGIVNNKRETPPHQVVPREGEMAWMGCSYP